MLNASHSIADICDVRCYEAPGSDSTRRRLLIELPHGATRHEHYRAVRARLRGPLPEQLEQFFFVNTDVGTPECARIIGETLAQRGFSTLIMRSLIPRTLIDCNRIVDAGTADATGGMTAAIASYVRDDRDRDLLITMHRQYHTLVESAYREICTGAQPGLALQLHSYAPKSVQIDHIDDDIVAALRHAYEPAQYSRWAQRPDVELISETVDQQCLTSRVLIENIQTNFAAIGIDVAQNQTYHLHADTWAYRYATQYPERVLCLELNRGLLATPFDPFREMNIGKAQAQRLAMPIAKACASALAILLTS